MTWKFKCKYWIACCMVKLGKITQEVFTVEELNQLVRPFLPERRHLNLPGSDGEFTILDAEISLPDDKIHAQLYCSLEISTGGRRLYQAHIVLLASVKPEYRKSAKTLGFNDLKVTEFRLVNDDYSFIESATQLMDSILPGPFQGLASAAVNLTLDTVSALSGQQVKDYMSLFTKGNKQLVLDYHKPAIEELFQNELAKGVLDMRMDETLLDEKLFAAFGDRVEVEHQQLVFKF